MSEFQKKKERKKRKKKKKVIENNKERKSCWSFIFPWSKLIEERYESF